MLLGVLKLMLEGMRNNGENRVMLTLWCVALELSARMVSLDTLGELTTVAGVELARMNGALSIEKRKTLGFVGRKEGAEEMACRFVPKRTYVDGQEHFSICAVQCEGRLVRSERVCG